VNEFRRVNSSSSKKNEEEEETRKEDGESNGVGLRQGVMKKKKTNRSRP
jgi:hypothetical protein